MRCRAIALAVLAVAGCRGKHGLWAVPGADPEAERTTAQGKVVGGQGRYGSHAWLGIPFAAPPVGSLRWRTPKPPAPWSGTRNALAFPPPCPQFNSAIGGVEGAAAGAVIGDEDCLALNIWAPRFAPGDVPSGDQRLPVMFWIHGGGNTIGRSATYDGGHLAAEQGVVVVSTQYRLGPLGWFRHQALRANASDADEASGNFGTLDLIRSLEWVRDNISAFGGDPRRVTIFGESAGGVNVYTLLLARRAKGLFERAIVESGGLTSTTAEEAENFTDDSKPGAKNSSNEVILRMLGADRTPAKAALAAMSDSAAADFLRARTPAQLFDAYAGKHEVGMIDMPLVVHDGALLPTGSWLTAFAHADSWNQMPVIAGTNREEAKLFMLANPELIRLKCGLFPRFVNEPEYQAAADALSRMWKARGVDAPVAAMRASGERDVFAYRFDWHDEPTILGADVSRMLGAAHGIEVPFVFGHFDIGPLTSWVYDARSAPTRGQLSAAMMGYWSTFARTGTPNGGTSDLPTWSPAPAFMVLDTPVSSLHMSGAVEAPSRIIADVDADARLPTQREKCAVFLAMTGMGEGLTKADYPHAGAHGCADFPADAYPWEPKK